MGKLDEPLVMTALAVVGIDWSCRVVEHLSTSLLGSPCDGMVSVMYHQFLAKGVDETVGSTCYGNLQWIKLLDCHGVAEAVAPQAVGGRDNQLIGTPLLDFPDGVHLGGVTVTLLNGQELIEHAHIQQQ